MNGLPKQRIAYQIIEEPFTVPSKFRKSFNIQDNMFDPINEKGAQSVNIAAKSSQLQRLDPVTMSACIVKLMFVEKTMAYLVLLSIMMSATYVYVRDEAVLLVIGTWITSMLLVLAVAETVYQVLYNEARRIALNYAIYAGLVGKILLIALHPTPWTEDYNNYLHLALTLRLKWVSDYLIRKTIYAKPRAFRLTTLYGIKADDSSLFALKAYVSQMGFLQFMTLYGTMVVLYSHWLFLMSRNRMTFMSCFSVIVSTMPTVGFGDYDLVELPQRVVIVVVLLTAAAMNSFITLTMLKQFQMSTRQYNSYSLQQRLQKRQQMQQMSLAYIRTIFKMKRLERFGNSTQEDRSRQTLLFKKNYIYHKTEYSQYTFKEPSTLFNYFRGCMWEFKIKAVQAKNMLDVLLRRIKNHQRVRNSNTTRGHQLLDKRNTEGTNDVSGVCQDEGVDLPKSKQSSSIHENYLITISNDNSPPTADYNIATNVIEQPPPSSKQLIRQSCIKPTSKSKYQTTQNVTSQLREATGGQVRYEIPLKVDKVKKSVLRRKISRHNAIRGNFVDKEEDFSLQMGQGLIDRDDIDPR